MLTELKDRLKIRIYKKHNSDPSASSYELEGVLELDGIEISSDSVTMEYT